ncbi:hypothetical protein JCM14469_09550 [Desulfatiferula olefinivorans]
MAYPNIHNINLPDCCQKQIADINRRLKLANAFQFFVPVGVFCNMFGPSPKGINTLIAVHQTDFATFAQAMQMIGGPVRTVAFNICATEKLRHIGNGKLEKFWGAMADAFA